MTPEGLVKKHIKQVLDSLGVWYFMPIGGMYSRAGVPDFIGCYKGKLIAIEAKTRKGKTTALQERELRLIRQSGGLAVVINEDNVGELKQMLEDL